MFTGPAPGPVNIHLLKAPLSFCNRDVVMKTSPPPLAISALREEMMLFAYMKPRRRSRNVTRLV